MREHALWLYQRLTAHRRRRMIRSLCAAGRIPIAILFYHRIAKEYPNDWSLSPREFVDQLDWLEQNFDLVSLEEAQRRIQSSFCDRPTVSITFDDGYSENADFAIPELVRRNIPATYFVATEFVRTGKPFPHDAQAGVPLKPNTVEELLEFQELGIEIGAHTRNHVDIGSLNTRDEILDEILGSKQQLEQWLGGPIRYFSFPYGLPHNTSQLGVDIVQEAAFKGFCTAYGAWNWPSSSGFHLRRIHADPGPQRLKNWLTLDPRKLDDGHDLPFQEAAQSANFAADLKTIGRVDDDRTSPAPQSVGA